MTNLYPRVAVHPNVQRGFTLIELMIVVVIIAIIAMVAFPSYQDSIQKAKRTDGQSAVLQVMQAQERFFGQNFRYTEDLTELGYDLSTGVGSPEGYYTVAASYCVAGETDCVNVTATGDTSTDGHLRLNSLGNKTFIDHDGNPTNHW